MIDVIDRANLPEQVRSKDVIPRELPRYGWNPFIVSVPMTAHLDHVTIPIRVDISLERYDGRLFRSD